METTMSKRPIFLLLTFLLAACGGKPTSGLSTPSADQIKLEEQAVYAVLLKDTYSSSTIVIMDTTSTDPGGAVGSSSTIGYVLENMHDVDPSTPENFKVRNDKAYPLAADMDLGVQYILLSQDQRNEMFRQNQSGWEVFYHNYPNSPGITELSRVGFNNALDQALVYVGTQSNYLAGAGYYILLKKVEGTWTIDQKVMTWIS